ncbi:hypothetical protein PPACK8108_LOCUS10199 [Phakopsora pachyrhizi]|uniref:Uncharacterized protein n=1 Tax=Phakopsora pachyrhizi TaxID=170000 RepID=A0AAV0B2W6_PHAPC|nr:hypothetical protein PPACK8108_LOCUS10199 [Phakopsora pachyrhizi]
MGANESRQHTQSTHQSDGHQDQLENPDEDCQDLYRVLKVDVDASAEDIKRAFRRQALIHHPDKNRDDVELATRRFAKIQQAYEILSDENERDFYDRHRDEILNNNQDLTKPTDSSSIKPGLTVKQLLKFFDSSIWKDDFSESESSFYGIYSKLFHLLATEERLAREDSTIIYPSFGTVESKYDEDFRGMRALKYFYSSWSNFSTQKTFEWIETNQTTQQAERRIKRLIDKENQRLRDQARREYNETVRSLVSFVKKRDPRFLMSTASNPERWREQELQRIKRQLNQVAHQRARERQEEAQRYCEQHWQRQNSNDPTDSLSLTDGVTSSSSVEDEDGDEDEVEKEVEEILEEEPDQINDWYCVACGRNFNSKGAWDNHERSKKHKQNSYRLRKQMIKEDAELLLSVSSQQGEPVTCEKPSDTLEQSEEPNLTANHSKDQTEPENSLGKAQSIPIPGGSDDNQTINSIKGIKCLSLINGLSKEFDNVSGTGSNSTDEQRNEKKLKKKRRKDQKKKKKVEEQLEKSLKNFEDDDEESQSLAKVTELEPNENVTEVGKPEITKREKRRAREALKKQQQLEEETKGLNKVERCNVCGEIFSSKSKLFNHVRSEEHESADLNVERSKIKTPSKVTKKKVR